MRTLVTGGAGFIGSHVVDAFVARVNVEGTINVLRAAQATGVRRVVNTSSGGAIYGEGQTIPAPEDHPVAPEAPYGLSKFCAENYCQLFTRLHGLSTVSLRYGNVYGPRQDPLGEAGVIAIFCGKLLAGERPTIFGDGRQTRDYVYVGDVATANLLAAESDAGGPFNIGLGEEDDVLELVEALGRHGPTASTAPPRPSARRWRACTRTASGSRRSASGSARSRSSRASPGTCAPGSARRMPSGSSARASAHRTSVS